MIMPSLGIFFTQSLFVAVHSLPTSNLMYDCSIYPSCSQYGEGEFQILEDCHKYIRCTFVNGELQQENLECPGDLVFANEYGKCVDYNMATECKTFQETPCLLSCPRLTLLSTGNGLEFQERRLGCFRISGTMFGGTMVHYQNENGQYLAPDSTATPLAIHWLVSESYGAFNGGIRNRKYDYIRCPFTDWNQGWQVDVGLGNWVEDPSMVVTCYKGDGQGTTTPTTGSTDGPTTTTTSPGPSCHRENCNAIGSCVPDFLCCHYDVPSQSYSSKKCTCNDGFVFDELVRCTWPEFAGCSMDSRNGSSPAGQELRVDDHTCEDGSTCTCD